MKTMELRNVGKLAVVLGVIFSAPNAAAQTASAADVEHDTGRDPEPKSGQARGHVHNGIFLRAALGAAYFHSDVEFPEESATGELTGTGVGGSVLVGGTPVSGLVLGGGVLASNIVNPTIALNGREIERDYDVTLRLTSVGPFIQFYPEPTKGFYLQAYAGFMSATSEIESENIVSQPTTGTALAFATGYDFWVSREWSMGPEFRLLFADIAYSGEGSDEKSSLYTPTLTFSATFH